MVPATANGRPAGRSAFTSDEFSVTACSSLSLAQAPHKPEGEKAGTASARTVRGTLFMASPFSL